MDAKRLKWVPVIDEMSCTGCNKCVQVCAGGSLALVNNVSTLINADTCGSESHCIPVCPEACIQMRWLEEEGDPAIGIWRLSTEPYYAPEPLPH